MNRYKLVLVVACFFVFLVSFSSTGNAQAESGIAIIAINTGGAVGAGHVGVAYLDTNNGKFYCGAVELHPWTTECDNIEDVKKEFRSRGFDFIKIIDSSPYYPDPKHAGEVLQTVHTRIYTYFLTTNDCLTAVNDVLTAYGVPDLPDFGGKYLPNKNVIPNEYFRQVPGQVIPLTDSDIDTHEIQNVWLEASSLDHKASLSPGWDFFNGPISSGSVTWNIVGNTLRVKFELDGAEPNHKYTLMGTFFDPDADTKLPNINQISSWAKYGSSVAPRFNCCREGICASGPGEITFGYMNTDSNGDGISQFDFNMPLGIYYTQFSIRWGECWPGKGDYSGCGVVYRSGNKYGDGFETIAVDNIL